jgi:hypothetical protein
MMAESPFQRSATALTAQGLPPRDAHDLPASTKRSPDDGWWRLEVPSVETPRGLETVFGEAARRGVPVHRASQGGGAWMLTDDELDAMAQAGGAAGAEILLFVGPRAAWGTGVQITSSGGRIMAGSLRGSDNLAYAIEDTLRAADHGIDGVLVADLGLLAVLGTMKTTGELPPGFALKVSVSFAIGNAATARVLEDLGATSLNLPTDLDIAAIAAIRQAVDVPLDVYIEAPDDFGGAVRYYDAVDIVRTAAPVYLKYTMRNAPSVYPAGAHIAGLVTDLCAERVRRASLGIDVLRRYLPEATPSPWPAPASVEARTTSSGLSSIG